MFNGWEVCSYAIIPSHMAGRLLRSPPNVPFEGDLKLRFGYGCPEPLGCQRRASITTLSFYVPIRLLAILWRGWLSLLAFSAVTIRSITYLDHGFCKRCSWWTYVVWSPHILAGYVDNSLAVFCFLPFLALWRHIELKIARWCFPFRTKMGNKKSQRNNVVW